MAHNRISKGKNQHHWPVMSVQGLHRGKAVSAPRQAGRSPPWSIWSAFLAYIPHKFPASRVGVLYRVGIRCSRRLLSRQGIGTAILWLLFALLAALTLTVRHGWPIVLRNRNLWFRGWFSALDQRNIGTPRLRQHHTFPGIPVIGLGHYMLVRCIRCGHQQLFGT